MFLICKFLNKMKLNSNKEALKIPLVIFFRLFDADLLFVWMNNFRHRLHFRSASCPVMPIVLIISQRSIFILPFLSDISVLVSSATKLTPCLPYK